MSTTTKGVLQKGRVKTDIRLGPTFAKYLEKLLVGTGLSKNAFFVMAGCLFALRVAQHKSGGAKQLIDAIEKEFTQTLAEVRGELD